jgi:hypothetical protein
MSITNTISAVGNTINAVDNGVNTMVNIADALSNASSDNIMSILRGSVIPAGAEAVGDLVGAIASFTDDSSDDWRVRLSLPSWTSFKTSAVLGPLKKAGGLVFPYTPTISINQTAKYTSVSPIHSNFQFNVFQSSDPGKITITAPMYVEDAVQAQYWIAMLHYLRSLTKMFSGNDPKAGNPPPIVFLNGYGNYVFKNIPVVVTGFDVQLGNECDYIGCSVAGSLMGEIGDIAGALGGLAGTVGNTFSALGEVAAQVVDLAGGVEAAATVLSGFGLGGTTNAGTTHVPTKSSFTVNLQTAYSRDSVRKFSLDTFVTGGYLNGQYGYV